MVSTWSGNPPSIFATNAGVVGVTRVLRERIFTVVKINLDQIAI
jgi:xanthine/uracil permease